MSLSLELPWPPSVNHYWRKYRNRMVISEKGLAYRGRVDAVVSRAPSPPLLGRLAVSVVAFPPDRRVRDLDNLLKSLLDSLQTTGVYRDDSQIDRLAIERREIQRPGWVWVRVEEIGS